MEDKEIKACKCKPSLCGDSVIKLNDDFWKCPVCGGLIVRHQPEIIVPEKKVYYEENEKLTGITKIEKEKVLHGIYNWNACIDEFIRLNEGEV